MNKYRREGERKKAREEIGLKNRQIKERDTEDAKERWREDEEFERERPSFLLSL